MYYPSSENKGADQLRGYREADLRLCFRLCGLLVFPWGGSLYYSCLPSFIRHDGEDVQQLNCALKGLSSVCTILLFNRILRMIEDSAINCILRLTYGNLSYVFNQSDTKLCSVGLVILSNFAS